MNTVTQRASSITIFLADGVPDGLRTVVKAGSIGHFIACPRSRFPDARASAEFTRTGVYILCGPSEDSDLPTIYVGEGDPTRPRLEQHYRQKDFWTSLILFTANYQLDKARVQYLESRLVSLARAAKRCALDNGNDPQLPTLAIADTAAMDTFLEEMLLIFPLLGLTVFEVPSQPPKPVKGKASPGTKPGPSDTTLYLKARGIKASGYDRSEGFVVLAGSEAVGDKKCMDSLPPSALEVRNGLVKQGVLVPDGDHFKFTQDYSLNSPSQAAAVVMGCSANGLQEWEGDQGRPLKDIRVALSPPSAPSPPPSSGVGGYAEQQQARLARATAAHQQAMNVLGARQVLPDQQKKDLARHLSVMSKPQLKSLYNALGGTAAIVGAQRTPWVHAIKAILSGGAAAPQPALTPAAPSPAPPTAPASTPAPATPAAPSPAIVDDPHDLNRFVQAQVGDFGWPPGYEQALCEIKSGRKRSHWIWYIFPQLNRLGSSSASWNYKHYAIKSAAEAKAYLNHPILGPRLVECAEAARRFSPRRSTADLGIMRRLQLLGGRHAFKTQTT